MTARELHTVVAVSVENPALILRWRDDPQLLRGYGVDPDAVDLDRLWRFAGLTTKVRHRALREQLPVTFRLMRVAGVDVDLFAAYASDCAARGARLARTTEGLALDLMTFLSGWLDREDPVQALLWDMIRHERTLARFARSAPAMGSSPNLRWSSPELVPPTSSTVPRIRGELVLHEMVSDPRSVAEALEAGLSPRAAIPRAPALVGYWRADAAREVTILQLDQLGYHTLSLVDGVRSIGALHRGLGGVGRAPGALLALLAELEGRGIVALRREP